MTAAARSFSPAARASWLVVLACSLLLAQWLGLHHRVVHAPGAPQPHEHAEAHAHGERHGAHGHGGQGRGHAVHGAHEHAHDGHAVHGARAHAHAGGHNDADDHADRGHVHDGFVAGLLLTLFDHDEAQCRVLDAALQHHGLATCLATVVVLLPPASLIARFDGDFVARWATLFDARGPPAAL